MKKFVVTKYGGWKGLAQGQVVLISGNTPEEVINEVATPLIQSLQHLEPGQNVIPEVLRGFWDNTVAVWRQNPIDYLEYELLFDSEGAWDYEVLSDKNWQLFAQSGNGTQYFVNAFEPIIKRYREEGLKWGMLENCLWDGPGGNDKFGIARGKVGGVYLYPFDFKKIGSFFSSVFVYQHKDGGGGYLNIACNAGFDETNKLISFWEGSIDGYIKSDNYLKYFGVILPPSLTVKLFDIIVEMIQDAPWRIRPEIQEGVFTLHVDTHAIRDIMTHKEFPAKDDYLYNSGPQFLSQLAQGWEKYKADYPTFAKKG